MPLTRNIIMDDDDDDDDDDNNNNNNNNVFYIHGSVHCESNLITVQQDATYSIYYISVGSSTCFGC